MGILATHRNLVPGDKIIVSDDKDLEQIPGWVLRPASGVALRVGHESAEYWLWMQVLMGDPTDGFKGIPKIGQKKAAKILSETRPDEPYFNVVLNAYLKAGLTTEYLASQINVARILQADTYDFIKKEPRLWQM
jgi:DNA polymerase-1